MGVDHDVRDLAVGDGHGHFHVAGAVFQRHAVVLAVVCIKDGPCNVAGLVHDIHALALHPGALVHETVAFLVDEGEAAVEHGACLRMQHQRERTILHVCTDPHRPILWPSPVEKPAGPCSQRCTRLMFSSQ